MHVRQWLVLEHIHHLHVGRGYTRAGSNPGVEVLTALNQHWERRTRLDDKQRSHNGIVLARSELTFNLGFVRSP
jgi:hypothetical protein